MRDRRRLDVRIGRSGNVADFHRTARHAGHRERDVEQVLRVVDLGMNRNAGFLRRLAQNAARKVGVIGGHGGKDVAQRRSAAEQFRRNRLDVEFAIGSPVHVDGLDVRDCLEQRFDAVRDQVGERRLRQGLGTDRNVEQGFRSAVLLYRRGVEVGRQVDARRVHGALDVDRGDVQIGAQLELNADRRRTFLRGRGQLVEVVDVGKLIFDRLDDQPLHFLGRRAGVVRKDDDDRERRPRRIVAAANF